MKLFSLVLLSQTLRWEFSEAINVSLTLYTKLASKSIEISLFVDVVINIDISFEEVHSISIKRYFSLASTLIEVLESITN